MSHRLASATFVVLSSLGLLLGCGIRSPGVHDPQCALPEGCAEVGGHGVGGASGEGADPFDDPTAAIPSGPRITFSVRGTTAPVAHEDPWSGQTPATQVVAVRSLYLLREPADPNPVKVFDHGSNAVEVDLVSGEAVEVASVVAESLPAGVFTVAKVGVAYVRYAVAARLHSVISIDGHYRNVQVLSDDAVVDGVSYKKGHFRYAFEANGTTYGALQGENAPMPAVASSGGLTLDSSGTQSFYVFAVRVGVDPGVGMDLDALVEINVHESFRWEDQQVAGYAAKIFDTTPTMFEPVMSFGGNSFTLTLAP